MALSESQPDRAGRLDNVPRKMLRVSGEGDRKPVAVDHRHEIGQALEWAIDRARLTKQQVSAALGYPDQSAVSRWVTGSERVQIDKLREFAPEVYREFLIALLQVESGVTVRTVVELERVG